MSTEKDYLFFLAFFFFAAIAHLVLFSRLTCI